MKKFLKGLLLVVICVILSGCFFYRKNETSSVSSAINKSNYEKYDYFVGIDWVRKNGNETEYLKFYKDGKLTYSTSDGMSINDSDVCSKFTYNPSNRTISLICYQEVLGTVKDIVIKEYDNNTLVLDFNGDLRVFTKK